MCGRYATTRSATDLSALFDASDETGDGLAADYNVAPTDAVPIVRRSRSAEATVLSTARWGLVPSWAKDTSGAARMINARAETVATTRAYAPSFATRRCLVPADGWYEWVRHSPRQRQPYFMTRSDGGVLAFAGLWSVWGDKLLTCTIVTTAAVGELSLVHERMPLALPPDRWRRWLEGDAAAAVALLEPAPADYLESIEIRPVGAAVGDVRNDGPGLVERVPAAPLGVVAEQPQDLTLFD
ncbi:SOS response-associated peptidase [Planosporangium thailandense]|uniref:Abasic site processing protein n=1 Tax=Planosporangium thailandense TaxID=765197 RepID=A0ABX0Y0D9_9ACTN|nr:SOS response-associated peptidase [Planosporangium thailandense]NJC70932.1 SOS response-associated peptidase [Planosporangium thailandense]